MSGLGLRLGIDRWFGRGASGVSLPSNSVAPAITGDPVVGQRLYSGTGTWSNSPTTYEYQWYKDNVAISGETADNYLVVDADVGSVFKCRVTASNAAGSANATSSNTSAVTAIDNGGAAGTIPNAITAFSRTSTSGDNSNAFGMQVSISFGSNVYEGYTLHAHVYSDSALTTLTQDVPLLLTHDLVQSDADVPSALLAAGLTKLGATDWLQLTVETTSPNGLYYGYTYPTAISPTDAVSAMTWSATDKVGVTMLHGNLTAAQGSAPGGVRASRGVSSGKFYVEFIANAGQINLYDSSASLTTDQESAAGGGTPSAHAAVYTYNNTSANYNTTTITTPNFAGASFTASFSGTTMTVTAVGGGGAGALTVGDYVGGPSIPWGTTITAQTSGSAGSTGTYTISNSVTLASTDWIVSGPIIGMAVDATADKIWWAKNNTWFNSGNPAAGTNGLSISGISKPVYPEFCALFNGQACRIFPGTPGTTTGFAFTPPAGFVAP